MGYLNYICPRSNGKARPIDGRLVNEVDVDGPMFHKEATLRQLGDMMCSVGGGGSEIVARLCGLGILLKNIAHPYHQALLTRQDIHVFVCSAMIHGGDKNL